MVLGTQTLLLLVINQEGPGRTKEEFGEEDSEDRRWTNAG